MLRARADVVFNMISNVDEGAEVLARTLDLVRLLDRPTVNDPRLIMNTGRDTVARRLAEVPGCVVPATLRIDGPALAEAASGGGIPGFRPPLLARVAGRHGGDDFEKLDDWPAVASFVSRSPDARYYLIEYIDYRSADDLYRKYRVIFIDGEIMPYHLAIHDHWKVHYFRTNMAAHAWMREEEARFLADMDTVLGPANRDTLRAIAAATGLDYGGVDCGIDRDGRLIVFEANASMLVHDETEAVFVYKNPYVERIRQSFHAMLSRRRSRG